MRRSGAVAFFVFLLGAWAAVTVPARPAAAGDNDLILGRLVVLSDDTGAGMPTRAVGQSLELRALVSELGVALAPRLLAPADTLGFGGFQFSADIGWTSISSEERWWRAMRSSPDASGAGTEPHGAGMLPTIGLFARKGIWLPAPSVEFGAGMVHLFDSKIWSGQAYVKLALQEGYHDLPIPSVAVRGGVSRLIGQKDLDLTVVSIDGSISKHLGVGGTWGFDPYGGYGALVMIPRSEVIDPTPHIDPLDPMSVDDRALNFVFKDQDNILRHRLFLGAKLQYYVFQLTVEGAYALAGSSIDDRSGDVECSFDSTTTACDSPDQANAQKTFTVSAGFDF
ncbi:MAG: hypothetical protein K8M05_39925 [Deltaproteobacteria bacterium]|nr:hypothetical protein [Kofleriaceae bacterium]